MRVTKEMGCFWYDGEGEHAQLRACVGRSYGGWSVTTFWPGRTYNCGGYGAGGNLTLEEAQALAEKFVTGQPVPEDMGGPHWEEAANAKD
jgi:hypothetical protein